MLRYWKILVCVLFSLSAVACNSENDIQNLSKDVVYFFYQDTCPHCHTAGQYIKDNHPNMKIKALDVKMPGNMRLLQQAAKSYELGDNVGTPLICFGKNYIMGWNEHEAQKLDMLAGYYEK